MRRTLLRGLLVGCVPALLIGAAVGGLVFMANTPSVSGGTVLTYEVKGDDLPPEEMTRLADTLKQRIDPDDRGRVLVRPVGRNRVEVAVPVVSGNKDAAAEVVDVVRQSVRATGLLEFRILANADDDAEAVKDAGKLLDDPTGQEQELIRAAAEKGLPPPAPAGTYLVKAAGDAEVPVAYEWVELGKEERESLALNEQYETVGKPFKGMDREETHTNHFFDEVAKTRGKTHLHGGRDPNGSVKYSWLLYSREFTKTERTKDEGGKRVEYFYLSRVSDADALKVAGDVKLAATMERDPQHGPVVVFNFVSGGDRFSAMTTRNRRTSTCRMMAVSMDGKVVSAPRLNEPLSGRGQIQGNYDTKSANQLVSILRSGSLNVEVKPDPVSETPLDPATEAAVHGKMGQTATRYGLFAAGGTFAGVFVLAAGAYWLVALLTRRRAR